MKTKEIERENRPLQRRVKAYQKRKAAGEIKSFCISTTEKIQ